MEVVDPASGEILAQTPDSGEAMPLPADPDAVIRVDTGKRIIGQAHG